MKSLSLFTLCGLLLAGTAAAGPCKPATPTVSPSSTVSPTPSASPSPSGCPDLAIDGNFAADASPWTLGQYSEATLALSTDCPAGYASCLEGTYNGGESGFLTFSESAEDGVIGTNYTVTLDYYIKDAGNAGLGFNLYCLLNGYQAFNQDISTDSVGTVHTLSGVRSVARAATTVFCGLTTSSNAVSGAVIDFLKISVVADCN